MRIGIDVGGTNTDAVLMDGRRVLGAMKTPTTTDVGDGIIRALQALCAETKLDPVRVTAVMIGTTHFTNAIVEIGGVRTNFRMPDVYSFGLGGGSLVGADHVSAPITIGPQSVGYELTTQALVFGGRTLTATDVAVAAGLAIVGPLYFGYDIDYRPVESRFG